MRAVVQRVARAEVRVLGESIAAMREGLLALIGVERGDEAPDAHLLADKLVHLRVFPDAEGRMNRSLLEVGGTLGVVSQFTLLGDCRKGRRPGYERAAPPEQAEALIEALVARAVELGAPVVQGRFRATMQVELENQGPVTLILDTRRDI